MNIKKHIPNFLTTCNLLCGVFGIASVFLLDFELKIASYLIFLACVFDFLDGFAARLLKVSSPIGKELDSLADMVTFGVLPGFMMASLLGINFLGSFASIPEQGYYYYSLSEMDHSFMTNYGWKVSFIAFLVPVFSALRLAKFNIDTRQTDKFIGLPTPANALLVAALPFIAVSELPAVSFFATPIVLLIMVPVLCYLLVAELPLLALKFKSYGWNENKMRYFLIISAIVLLGILNIAAIPLIIILYIILSLIENKLMSSKGI